MSTDAAERAGGDADYGPVADDYRRHRRPDPRIAEAIAGALGAARTVLNVGAGGGSYEPADRAVVALEPSAAMRARRPAGAAPVVAGVAERLPFADGAFDAIMAVLTLHQWPNWRAGLAEMRRVSAGPVAILTCDIERLRGFWLYDYLPELFEVEARRFPAIQAIAAALGDAARIEPIAVPSDCTDGFLEAWYGRPEAFLDPSVRRACSSFAFVGQAAIVRMARDLAADLASGAWDRAHGRLRAAPTRAGSLTLVVGH